MIQGDRAINKFNLDGNELNNPKAICQFYWLKFKLIS